MGASTNIIANCAALDLDNPSIASTVQLLAQGVGDVIDNVRTEFDNTKISILSTINNQRYGRNGYYITNAKAFQLGDDLVPTGPFLDSGYAVIDKTKQIVAQAAFENNDGALSLKVAKLDAITGLLLQLSASELDSFKSYFVNFEIPGLPVSVVSLAPNTFSFSAIATYNAGYNLNTLTTNIKAAMLLFDQTFLYDGVLYSDALSQFVKQSVPGVIDFFITDTQIDEAPFTGSTTLTAGSFNYVDGIYNKITYKAING